MTELPAIVQYVLFPKKGQLSTGFALFSCQLNVESSKYKVELEDEVKTKCKASFSGGFIVSVGMYQNEDVYNKQFVFIGDFTNHPKYGGQFKANFYYNDVPNTKDGFRMALCDLPNIKESRSQEIIDMFGVEEAKRILDNDLDKLLAINGITEARLPAIKASWDEHKTLRDMYDFLIKHEIGLDVTKKIYKTFGKNSLNIIKENPYKLSELRGIDFARADGIAHKVMEKVPADIRIFSCISSILAGDVKQNGNLCYPYDLLKDEVRKWLQESEEKNHISTDVEDALKEIPKCIKSHLDSLVVAKDLSDSNTRTYIYLKKIWEKEKYIAKSIYGRSQHEKRNIEIDDDDMKDAEEDICKFSGRTIILDDSQKNAIKSAFEHKMTVITGGGGSGKSTICRCIYHLAAEKGLSVRFMSPTGKASQVLTEKTGFKAATIHRSLKMTPDTEFPKESIVEDIVVIDEVSMVGIDTMFAVLHAMEQNIWGHIIFVGDANQLPSVSPGNFLSDIMKLSCINVIRLEKIHRQDENSYIALLANDISKGKVVDIPSTASDIKWHELTADDFGDKVKDVVQNYLNGGNSIDDLQVISPMYKGNYGVNNINDSIQDLMTTVNSTADKLLTWNYKKFHMGDRVIQTENNYEKYVFNGDIGVVKDLGCKVINPAKSDKKENFLLIRFYNEDLMFIEEEIDQLKVAWALTIHKFQGSQTQHVILIVSNESPRMITKELVYTGMTRAQKHLDIYGHTGIFKMAPTKSAIRKRYTNMVNMVKELSENRKIFQLLGEK